MPTFCECNHSCRSGLCASTTCFCFCVGPADGKTKASSGQPAIHELLAKTTTTARFKNIENRSIPDARLR